MGKQKRSLNTYTKINTIFYRDVNNVIMPYDEFVSPELEWLKDCMFDAEEKIDGTNIRIEAIGTINYVNEIPKSIDWRIEFKGKTDNANIPKNLDKYLHDTFDTDKVLNAINLCTHIQLTDDNGKATEAAQEKRWVVIENGNLTDVLDISRIPVKYTMYGEGYGAGIQACGGRYIKNGVGFIGFDVKIEYVNSTVLWLLKENRDEVFSNMGVNTCPYKGKFTINEAIDFVRKGFKSEISEDKTFDAEGLVLRAPHGLLDRRGNRIIFKVKTCDFIKYRAKYGTDDKVEQIKNSFI